MKHAWWQDDSLGTNIVRSFILLLSKKNCMLHAIVKKNQLEWYQIDNKIVNFGMEGKYNID